MTWNGTPEALRASDTERDEVAALLSQQMAAGRLTMGEFEERVDATYAARTRGQLQELTADLPADGVSHERAATAIDPCLLCVLLFVCPPAGLVYWLMMRRRARGSDEKDGEEREVPTVECAAGPRYAQVGGIPHE